MEETAPFAEAAGSAATSCGSTPGFSPRRRRLEELDGLVEALAPHRVAIELRSRDWVREAPRQHARMVRRPRRGLRVRRRAAGQQLPDYALRPRRGHPPRPGLPAPARPQHRRYLSGKSVAGRFGWRYEEDELEERSTPRRGMAEQARCTWPSAMTAVTMLRPPPAPRAARPSAGRRGPCGSSRPGGARSRPWCCGPLGHAPQRCARRSTRSRPQPVLSFRGYPSWPGQPGPLVGHLGPDRG